MAITDQVAITFSNDQIRERSEKIRNLYYEMKNTLADWNGGYNAMFPNDGGELVEDNRQTNEGVRQITGQDVNSLMTLCNTLITDIEASGNLGVVEKICVRKLVANG